MEVEERNDHEPVKEQCVSGSFTDYRGRTPPRASTGSWRAALFIVAIEFSERLCYFGISTTLIIYLTKVLHQDVQTAAKTVNYWTGVTAMMPLAGGFVADAYLGCFSTVLCSTAVYILGLVLLTMSRAIPSLQPSNRRAHGIVFFLGIYLISAGTGGHKPALESFGADQFDGDDAGERKQKMSFFNWWNFALSCGCLLGVTVIVFVQDHVGWLCANVVLASVMAASLAVFAAGRRFYRYRKPAGSPFIPLLQVLVAAVAKRKLHHPPPELLCEAPEVSRGRLLRHTQKLRFLDKAATLEETTAAKQNPWRTATVTRVEEAKLIINMIPIWLTSLPLGICIAQTPTFFIKQSTVMNRRVPPGFLLPPASIYALSAAAMLVTVAVYDAILVPFLQKLTGNERGITVLQRIGVGMALIAAAMGVAAVVESKRRNSAAEPVSVLWLAPQFLIVGAGDAFALVGLQEYFYDQVPEAMRCLGIAAYLSVIGAANFLSSLLITAVGRATEMGGSGWFGPDLDRSRLDRFYWLLAGIAAANIGVYAVVARRYSSKSVVLEDY